MKALFDRLHNRLGDFWFYSLMIFCACRVADVMNVFVGLWLVPKYVDPSELGAVMPLTQFANFLALPATIFATTFMKEVNTLATHGEYGKMKTLMRGVFIGVGAFLVLALVTSRLLMPYFLERIRVVEGALGILIITASFLGSTAPVYQNALQALKKFNTISLLGIIGAPVRLITMLIAMPFRPLSGYFVGQAATPAFNILASIFALRKELSVKAEPYWSKPIAKRLGYLFIGITAYQIFPMIAGLVEQTVLRQRLPELDSAAYYMVSRFSDISNFISGALLMIMFPYTAELAERGQDTSPLVVKSSIATAAAGILLALLFGLFGKHLLALLPHGREYANYNWALPWLIGLTTITGIQSFHVNTEVSAGRFGFLRWWIPLHLAYPLLLLGVTGYGYFKAVLPETAIDFLAHHNVSTLSTILWWMTGLAIAKTAGSALGMLKSRTI